MSFKLTVGRLAIAGCDLYTNEAVVSIVPTDALFSPYLRHFLSKMNFLKSTDQAVKGATLNKIKLAGLDVVLPPIGEQRAIAGVLDAIDEAIERTEVAIVATESLRQALLHELLTRGLPGWHSRWKQVAGIGTVPACWPITTLGDLCSPPEYGASAPSIPSDPHLPRYVRITDISDEGRLIDTDPRSADPRLVRGYELQDGDLLFARSGATVGKTYLYSDVSGSCVFAGYLIRFQASRATVRPDFLFAWTRTDTYRRWVASTLHAGAQPNINAAEYSALPIPCPPIREQEQIMGATSAIQARRDADDDALATLRWLKSATSNALLTGSVRVPTSMLGSKDYQ